VSFSRERSTAKEKGRKDNHGCRSKFQSYEGIYMISNKQLEQYNYSLPGGFSLPAEPGRISSLYREISVWRET
jgi:hypothetical protein